MKVKQTNKMKKLKSKKTRQKPELNGTEKHDSDEVSSDDVPPPIQNGVEQKSKKKIKTKSKKKTNELKLHKKELEGLKDIDPEFYKFLKQNDKKLLDFNLDDDSDEDQSGGEAKDDEEAGSEDEMVHKPNEDLEMASDESDFGESDAEDEDSETKTVTLKLLRTWQAELQANKVQITTIRNVVQAFSSALASVSGQETGKTNFKVEGSAVFNGVIQLCVLYLQPGIYKFLGQQEKARIALHKCKKWKNIRAPLKSYFLDLSRLIEHVTSGNILTVLLKHLHQTAVMVGSYSQISKTILKRLVTLWSTSEETVRVLSFLCILKITRNQQTSLLNQVLKAMYLSYVRNSKFVSPTNLPGINFMRRSLVEMFALDLNVSYQHVFLYIRQLAIHLRNALILKKKDSLQAVYNWQFINSIRLWTELLGSTANKPQLEPLVYPLVSIIIGVIKLIPTAQYFPLRFHCIQSLISLQKQTNTFIPVLPFIVEVLNSNTFNKKHTVVSMKPMSFACILRLNKSQMAENGFRDEVIENVCGLTLEYLAHEACSLAFPDLVVPAVVMLKQYLKTCKNSNYTRKLKQILDKIIDNSKFIEQERRKINFTLKDINLIKSWEIGMRNKGTPLTIYYNSWVKTHETKKKRQAANTDDINDYDVPMIKRKRKNTEKDGGDGPVELFPSDDEDENILEASEGLQNGEKKEKRQKKKKQKTVKEDVPQQEEEIEDDGVDIVKDLDIDDW